MITKIDDPLQYKNPGTIDLEYKDTIRYDTGIDINPRLKDNNETVKAR